MILETFYFLFETDASRVVEEIDKGSGAAEKMAASMAQVDAGAGEIVITSEAILAALERVVKESMALPKGFQEAGKSADDAAKKVGELDKKTADVTGKMKGMVSQLARLAIGTIAISTLKSMTIETARQNAELQKQADTLRMDVEQMQLYQHAFEAAGSSADGFNSLFAKMKERSKDPIKAIEQLANKFNRLNEAQRQAQGKRLGLDQGTITLIGQGKRGLDELLKKERELGVVTKEQIEQSRKFNETMRVTDRLWNDVRQRLSMMVLPALQWVFEKISSFVSYMRKHESFVSAFFVGLAVGITALYLPAVTKAIGATWLWLAPFIAIAAAAAVIALIIDDVLCYLNGANSVTGELAKKWPVIGEAAKAVGEFVKKLWEGIKLLPEGLKEVLNLFEMIWTIVKNIFGVIGDMLKSFATVDAHLAGLDGSSVEINAEKGRAIMGQTGSSISTANSNVVNNSKKGTVNRTNSVNVQNVTVSTNATDAAGIAGAIGKSLKDQFSGAISQFDDGVYA